MLTNQKDQMHPEDRRNMLIFAMVALVVWLGYEYFVIQPRLAEMRAQAVAEKNAPVVADATATRLPREDVLANSKRVSFQNGEVAGTIALTGGRIDDLRLLNYNKTLKGREKVELLSPPESDYPMVVEFGWIADKDAATETVRLPGAKTEWQTAGNATLEPGHDVSLFWENGDGVRFERVLALDEHYMFTVTQRIVNRGKNPVTAYPFQSVSQQGLSAEHTKANMHQGPIAYLDGKLTEIPYQKMQKKFTRQDIAAKTGWIGITQEYWFTGLVPAQGQAMTYSFTHTAPPTRLGRDRFQVDAVGEAATVQPGGQYETATKLFAGAKEVNRLDQYEKDLKIPHFDLAVDFGIFYFMTKPLFKALHFFYQKVGNMGVAIIMLTVLVRLFVFPLANISYRSFAKLRKIAPQMKEVREKFGDDQAKLQQALVKLYETEKVNPMVGCLPMLMQIPIFFALYKVMVITIELRHAPFFGWIHDLSAPDPTTIFNLFGLIPWSPPAALMIGGWPLMMLCTQLLQRNMNPPPQDKMQMYMINVMPFFFCYIMSGFASGLVVYWTFSGGLAMVQQYVIMRSMGVEVNFFRRPKVEQEMEKTIAEQPAVHPGLEVAGDQIEQAVEGDLSALTEGADPEGPSISGPPVAGNPARKKGGRPKKR